jgi:hypothetical protein
MLAWNPHSNQPLRRQVLTTEGTPNDFTSDGTVYCVE